MFTDDERKQLEEAGAAAYAMAVEMRAICNRTRIRVADLAPAVAQLEIIMRNLEALNTPAKGGA